MDNDSLAQTVNRVLVNTYRKVKVPFCNEIILLCVQLFSTDICCKAETLIKIPSVRIHCCLRLSKYTESLL